MEYIICDRGHFSEGVGTACKECISERNLEFLEDFVPKKEVQGKHSYPYKLENQRHNFDRSIKKRNYLARSRVLKQGHEPSSIDNFNPKDIAHILVVQDNCCKACFASFDTVPFEVDHINPIEYGGTNSVKNIQLLCTSCNRNKNLSHNSSWISTVRYRQVLEMLSEIFEEDSYAT